MDIGRARVVKIYRLLQALAGSILGVSGSIDDETIFRPEVRCEVVEAMDRLNHVDLQMVMSKWYVVLYG